MLFCWLPRTYGNVQLAILGLGLAISSEEKKNQNKTQTQNQNQTRYSEGVVVVVNF